MRTVRLGRRFDAVFVHDAVDYMTTEADLRAAIQTAHAHCRPGGIAVFVPDDTAETYEPATDHGGSDGADGRAVRFLEWAWDPDPDDTWTCHGVRLLAPRGRRLGPGGARDPPDRTVQPRGLAAPHRRGRVRGERSHRGDDRRIGRPVCSSWGACRSEPRVTASLSPAVLSRPYFQYPRMTAWERGKPRSSNRWRRMRWTAAASPAAHTRDIRIDRGGSHCGDECVTRAGVSGERAPLHGRAAPGWQVHVGVIAGDFEEHPHVGSRRAARRAAG